MSSVVRRPSSVVRRPSSDVRRPSSVVRRPSSFRYQVISSEFLSASVSVYRFNFYFLTATYLRPHHLLVDGDDEDEMGSQQLENGVFRRKCSLHRHVHTLHKQMCHPWRPIAELNLTYSSYHRHLFQNRQGGELTNKKLKILRLPTVWLSVQR